MRSGCSSTARELRDVAAGRAVLRQAGLAGETVLHGLLRRAANIRSRMWHCRRLTVTAGPPVFWLNPLTTDDGNGLRGFSGEGRVKAAGCAVRGLQGSRNGEGLLADNMR